MNKLLHLTVLVLLLLCLAVLLVPLAAQDNGRTIVYGFRVDPNFGSLMLCADRGCESLVDAMYIQLMGVDPETGWFAPNQRRALVENWDFADGNRELTLHLRDDLEWSDGTPITAADVMITYDLGLHPATNIGGEAGVAQIRADIESVEALDDHTIRIRFNQGSCTALLDAAQTLSLVPAHIYNQLLAEVGYEGLWAHEWFQQPSVISGPFRFGEVADDNTVTLLRNENFHDNEPGYVSPERFKQVDVATEDLTVETFLASELNVISIVTNEHTQEFMDAAQAGALQAYQYPENRIIFLALNQADPNNPQPALDENGQHINQGLHPIFGDKLVRQAVARAIDVDRITAETQFGFATRIAAYIIPNSWAYNSDLLPIPYDPQAALAMLAEAGWIPENPDAPASPDNRLICSNCLYAREVDPQFNGSHMEFELLQPQAWIRESNIIAEQLREIGATVNLEEVTRDSWVERVVAQSFDASFFGFRGGYPYNPATDDIFGPLADIPGSGFNMTSFYNEAYFALEATANSVPGCGLTERANIYRQMQAILYEEQPVIFMYANSGMYVAKNEVEGFAPYPGELFWNVDTWTVHEGD